MADGVYVRMAREIERGIEITARDPGPRELGNLRRDIEQFKQVLDTRFNLLEQASHERARARLPYKDE